MAFSPENSAIKVTKSLEERIAGASSQTEVQQILRDAAISQQIVRPDIYDPNVLLEVERGSAPRRFAQTITDPTTGKKVIFEGDTELDVTKQANEYMKNHFGQSADTTGDQPRGTDGRFVTNDDPTARIESDLVTRALQAQGIDLEVLREFSSQREQQDWSSAVEAFKEIHKDWIGGEENKNLIGQILIENQDAFNGLTPLESLEKAYQHAVNEGLLVETEESAAHDRIANANSPEEIREALGRSSTSLFGR